jgi:hypothetical protein
MTRVELQFALQRATKFDTGQMFDRALRACDGVDGGLSGW